MGLNPPWTLGCFVLATVIGVGACSGGPSRILPHATEIDPYVEFLSRGPVQDPVDYVMGLFDEADVVVIGERIHSEATQYDLILDIVSDLRFIDRVGHLFTEIGSISVSPKIDAYLNAQDLGQAERDAWRARIYRDFSDDPLWHRENYYHLLGRLYELNQRLTPGEKVQLHPVGLPFSWEGMTKEGYAAYRAGMQDRDERLAANVQDELRAVVAGGDPRRKALVIMNYRHAFPHLEFPGGGRLENTTGFLMERFPGRVKNVLLNTMALSGGPSESDLELILVADGKWDAAFEVTGNKPVGFDLEGTPFGADTFDLFPAPLGGKTFSDMFTGFVFYNPLSTHRLVNGIPELLDDGFELELNRRLGIVGGFEDAHARQAYIDARRKRAEETYESAVEGIPLRAPIRDQIRKWLERGPPIPEEPDAGH